MALLDIKVKDDNVKEVDSNVEGNSEPLKHQVLKLPNFCSRLRDYRSYDY